LRPSLAFLIAPEMEDGFEIGLVVRRDVILDTLTSDLKTAMVNVRGDTSVGDTILSNDTRQ